MVGDEVLATAAVASPGSSETFWRFLNVEWVDEALKASGVATLRRRRLPMDQVVWLVLGIALMRDRSIDEVVERLDLALPSASGAPVSTGAITPARDRLGTKPMQWLFDRLATHYTSDTPVQSKFHGLFVDAIDGTSLRVANSDVNREHFGGHRGGKDGRDSSYPLLRLVTLLDTSTHLLRGAAFGPFDQGEWALATKLWSRVRDHSVVLLDRLYFSADVLLALQASGTERHWLIRGKSNTRWTVIEQLGAGDAIVEMRVSDDARSKNPSLPRVWRARAIEYRRPGFAPQTLLTSMFDSERWAADEIAALYHQRWEIELAYDEVKTELLDREETLRSQSPERVEQELWGVLIVYNLIRLEMARVAATAKVRPTRISFIAAMHLIRDEWIWSAMSRAPGSIPSKLEKLRAKLRRFILPERRSDRGYERAVRMNRSNYPRLTGPRRSAPK